MAVATVVLIVICVVALVSLLVGGPSKKDNAAPAARRRPRSRSRRPRPGGDPAGCAAPRLLRGEPRRPAREREQLGQGHRRERRVLASSTGTQGMSAEFRGAQQLRFTFGNAAAVDVSCNGKALGPLGSEGQVVSRVLVLGDPACGRVDRLIRAPPTGAAPRTGATVTLGGMPSTRRAALVTLGLRA